MAKPIGGAVLDFARESLAADLIAGCEVGAASSANVNPAK